MKADSRYILAVVTGSLLFALFLIVGAWGLYPLYGQTLPQLLSERWNVSFRISAFVVSICVAAIGTSAVLVFSFGHRAGNDRPQHSREEVSRAP